MYKAMNEVNILVVGDVMLDEYWFGDVRRISPEAPVPVVHVSRSDERPGGAANVARNIVSLGGQATLLSVVGADSAADRLRIALNEVGVRHHLNTDASIRTTLKLRVLGQNQQMLRIDFEELPSHEVLQEKKEEFEKLVIAADAIIFSDYGKGTLHHIENLISIAKRLKKVILIDPKGRDYGRYAGATVLTPNRAELADAVGGWSSSEEMDQKAENLRSLLKLDALLLTMSEQGMKLYLPGSSIYQPADAREVFDVSGAGDTVIAALAVMCANGASWDDAIGFANAAAGVAVAKLGTSMVSLEEVMSAMSFSSKGQVS